MMKLIQRIYYGKWRMAVVSFLCLSVLSLDGIMFPYFLGRFTDILTAEEYGSVSSLLMLWFIIWLTLVSSQFAFSYFFGKLRRDINIDLKDMVFKRSYDGGNSGEFSSKYISMITADIKQIEKDFIDNSMTFIYCILQSLVTLVFLLVLNWQVGLVFVAFGFLPALIPKFTSKWLKKGTEQWQKENHSYIRQLEDGLNARNLVKRYDAVPFIFKELYRALSKEQSSYFTMNIRQSASSYLVSALYVVSAMASLVFGAWMVIQGNITIGVMITIYMAADRVTSPLISLANIYNNMAGSEPLLRKVLDSRPSTEPTLQPVYTNQPDYLVHLEDVSVGYDKNHPVLENLNFKIRRGDKILIEGP